jgi:apolipoprotein N-acyltransferase
MITFIAAFGLTAMALAADRYRRATARHSKRDMAGAALAALAVAVMLINPFLPGRYGDAVFTYVAINGLIFALLIWMVVQGYRSGERFQVYSAFVAYGAGMIAVYFMEFFTLMNRSLFVMGGGAVLIAGVYLLERQRRRTTAMEGGAS